MATVRRTPGAAGPALRQAVKGLNGQTGKVGWFESAKYEDGTPVALVALVQEYGSVKRGIPSRSYMRSTQDASQTEWKQTSLGLARAVAQGKMPPGAVMEGLTQKAEGDIRRTISRVSTPELAESTIRGRKSRNAKGEASTKPLVDTAVFLNTLTSQVAKK